MMQNSAEDSSLDDDNLEMVTESDISDIMSDDRDSDFDERNFESDFSSSSEGSEIPEIPTTPLSQKIIDERNKRKKLARCKFCHDDIASKNFMRHLERHHGSEKIIRDILKHPKKSRARREAVDLLRKNTNFDLFINGETRPYRRPNDNADISYYPCAYCKGLFLKTYLRRHAKSCPMQKHRKKAQNGKRDHISESHTVTACAMDPTNVISKMDIKKKVFDKMRGDEIAFEAKKDILIAHFGETYLKKHRRERMGYACSNRMRELSRILITCRKLLNDEKISFKDLIHPSKFDIVVKAVRDVVGYDEEKKTFNAPSLAMHMGTSLKFVSDELRDLILRSHEGFQFETKEDTRACLNDIKCFKSLIESRWNVEIASLANKDLMEKRWNKPLLLPLASDIKKFRDGTLEIASKCRQDILNLNNTSDLMASYKLLVHCTLALLIMFNRRRIGDVQYLKLNDYDCDRRSNFKDFETALTETEKALTKKYKRIVNSGKGSRAVVILVPQNLQKLIDFMLQNRYKFIGSDNAYVFGLPGSSIKWGQGDVAFRTLVKKIDLQHPEEIRSNKLRKHIATVMQILNLSKDEAKQFAHFMGHTEKTHQEFYELPVDIYQTAKVSKLLLMMEKGEMPVEYKGKSLSEIQLDPSAEFPIEDDGKLDEVENEVDIMEKLSQEVPSTSKCINTPERKELPGEVFDSDQNTRKKCSQRKKWTEQEMKFLEETFKTNIMRKKYPSGGEIKEFLRKTKMKRSVAVVKAKLQHLISKKNK